MPTTDHPRMSGDERHDLVSKCLAGVLDAEHKGKKVLRDNARGFGMATAKTKIRADKVLKAEKGWNRYFKTNWGGTDGLIEGARARLDEADRRNGGRGVTVAYADFRSDADHHEALEGKKVPIILGGYSVGNTRADLATRMHDDLTTEGRDKASDRKRKLVQEVTGVEFPKVTHRGLLLPGERGLLLPEPTAPSVRPKPSKLSNGMSAGVAL